MNYSIPIYFSLCLCFFYSLSSFLLSTILSSTIHPEYIAIHTQTTGSTLAQNGQEKHRHTSQPALQNAKQTKHSQRLLWRRYLFSSEEDASWWCDEPFGEDGFTTITLGCIPGTLLLLLLLHIMLLELSSEEEEDLPLPYEISKHITPMTTTKNTIMRIKSPKPQLYKSMFLFCLLSYIFSQITFLLVHARVSKDCPVLIGEFHVCFF